MCKFDWCLILFCFHGSRGWVRDDGLRIDTLFHLERLTVNFMLYVLFVSITFAVRPGSPKAHDTLLKVFLIALSYALLKNFFTITFRGLALARRKVSCVECTFTSPTFYSIWFNPLCDRDLACQSSLVTCRVAL